MENLPKTPESVLVLFKTKLCAALNINPTTLKLLIDWYVTASFGKASSKTHFAKVNTYNELSSFKMTIKVFFKFLTIARIKKIKITMTATTVMDKEVTVSEEINLLNFAESFRRETSNEPTKALKGETTEVKNGE